MKLHTVRLTPGEDLRTSLIAYANKHGIAAGSILTCVGALKTFSLRMAGATPDKQDIRDYTDTHEIVSLVGTITADDCHLHIALSNRNGEVIGGHLKEGSTVELTAEVVIAEDTEHIYTREHDEATGFTELVVTPKQS